MKTYRSRNQLPDYIDLKSNFTERTLKLEEKKLSKNIILTNLVEYAGEARTIIKNNDILRQNISSLKQNNINIKNLINKIITINKDLKIKQKKILINNNSNNNNINKNHNINSHKEQIISIVREYNEIIKKSNDILKEKFEKEKIKNENYLNNLEKEIENLKKTYEDSSNMAFMLENINKNKNSIIKALKESYDNFGKFQEIKKYIFVNDGISQEYIDKFFSKELALLQKNMLNMTQAWNKYKNKAIIFEQEKEELQKILKNPNIINQKTEKNDENNDYITNENDLFLLTFDEFEDESREITLETESFQVNENTESINNKDNNINNKITSLKLQNINDRDINKISAKKKDIYYIPQKKDYCKSVLKNSESVKKVNLNRNAYPPILKNRTVSIKTISKLNLKQIVFNKKDKFKKEEEKEIAKKRFEIENDIQEKILNKLKDNPTNIKIQMEIKEIKKDIQVFKNKIKKKKKIIKEFKKFCLDIKKNYILYIKNNNDYSIN